MPGHNYRLAAGNGWGRRLQVKDTTTGKVIDPSAPTDGTADATVPAMAPTTAPATADASK